MATKKWRESRRDRMRRESFEATRAARMEREREEEAARAAKSPPPPKKK